VQSDSFIFTVEFLDRPLTRRGILSTVSSVFDSIGLVSPVILNGKNIVQEPCQDGAKSDDAIRYELQYRWEKMRDYIWSFLRLRMPWCYIPHDFDRVRWVEIHHFPDADSDIIAILY